ncbi:MAG: glycosyl hydrolase family 28-related protein [Armatimonadota bacterium]|nr:glycosyl hydrolase family 28-related protein [Armatimonadota bacterium]
MKFRLLCAALVLTLACAAGYAREWNVADNGAVADQKTDCTAAFQKTLDAAAKAGGGVVNIPAGRFRINGNLSVAAGVTLRGSSGTTPFVGWDELDKTEGTVLLAYAGRGSNTGEPFIRLAGNAATIQAIMVIYPEFKRTDVPPIPYPPCIASQHTNNIAILDVNIVNPYEGIRLTNAHRHLLRNVQGYPSWRGLYVDECYDIGRVENIHFWPFGIPYHTGDPFSVWVNRNGTAFEFARTDWQYVTNTFAFGYGVGYKFSESEHGACNGQFLGIGADSCRRAIMAEQVPSFGILITNGEFVGQWESKDSRGVEVGPKCTGKVSLMNCSFWGPFENCVWMRAPGGQFTAIGCNFVDWDISKKGSPAVAIDAGRAIVQANTFLAAGTHVRIAKPTASAIVTANQARGGVVISNSAGRRAMIRDNETPAVVYSRAAKEYYTLMIGSENDQQVIKSWHGEETAHEWNNKGTKRWSTRGSQLLLPVLPGREYTLTVDVHVPKYAVDPGAGLYIGKRQIVRFAKDGTARLTGVIPASKADRVVLDVKCKIWVPKDVMPDSGDTRELGVAVRSITLKAKGSTAKRPFNGNTGE